MDNLFEQFANISKAHAYDILTQQVGELKAEIAQLKQDKSVLEIMLKGEQSRIQALKDFINEVRPDNPETIPLGEVDQEIEDELNKANDLKDINAFNGAS